MQRLVYLIAYPFLFLIGHLPFRLLYLFSDVIYLLTFYIIRYRRKAVQENLDLALPHLSKVEKKAIEKKFYKHMCDMFLEMIKTMSITQSEIEKRFVIENFEVYKDLENKGKSIALMCGHYASYEWLISINSKINFKGYAIYKRINNIHFDNLIKKIRSRFKAYLINSKHSIALIEENEKLGIKGLYGFASDQSPMLKPSNYWSKFMGIEVPVHTGAEMLAKRFDMNVIFIKVKKVKRGHYVGTFEVLSENVKEIPNYELTETFLRKIEQQIIEAPEFYLWTHKRWKHRGKKKIAK